MCSRIDRAEDAGPGISTAAKFNFTRPWPAFGGDRSETPEGTEVALRLIEKADALIEGFRPGVMERLGLGPEVCPARNPRLVYGRMTGWGQDGPLAQAAGHDINYIALTGALHAIGRNGETPGAAAQPGRRFRRRRALSRVRHVVAGLLEAQRSGKGQVVDAAMVDGAASLMTAIYGMRGVGHAGPTSAARTSSTPARISTTFTRPATANTSRSARSSRNSTPNYCA